MAVRETQHLRVIELAVSLGGVESLIEHPASMTHGKMVMSDDEREDGHISDGLIRFRYTDEASIEIDVVMLHVRLFCIFFILF